MTIYFLGKLLPDSRLKYRLRDFVFSNLIYRLKWGTVETPLKDGLTGKFHNLIFHLKESYTKELIGYEKHYAIREGDVVVDAGAYTGHFTVYAAKKVGPRGKVISFEADSSIYRLLEENVKLNNLTNVTLINKGVWSSEAELKFDSRGTGSHIVDGESADRAIKSIQTVSLDQALEELGISHVDLIKMDIEGAEIEAVNGARRLMEQPGVHFAIASYHILDGVRTSTLLEPQFAALGYSAVTEYPSHLTTYASKSNP